MAGPRMVKTLFYISREWKKEGKENDKVEHEYTDII